jgi:hypothetical protein
MANRTWPTGHGDGHIVQLDVFHQLHCLVSRTHNLTYAPVLTSFIQNAVRRAMGQFYYPSWNHSIYDDLDSRHVFHCIDSLRQSLMCSSDITPLVWGWNKKQKIVQGRVGVVHECRNFDKITEWTKEHAVYEMFDQSVWIPGEFVLDDSLV